MHVHRRPHSEDCPACGLWVRTRGAFGYEPHECPHRAPCEVSTLPVNLGAARPFVVCRECASEPRRLAGLRRA